jgi:hypothetical protein
MPCKRNNKIAAIDKHTRNGRHQLALLLCNSYPGQGGDMTAVAALDQECSGCNCTTAADDRRCRSSWWKTKRREIDGRDDVGVMVDAMGES